MAVIRGEQARQLFLRMQERRGDNSAAHPPGFRLVPGAQQGRFVGRAHIRVPDGRTGVISPLVGALAIPRGFTVVAVVSGGGNRRVPVEPGAVSAVTVADRLRTHTGLKAVALQVSSDTAGALVEEIRHLEPAVSAVYLVDTPEPRRREVQMLLGGVLPVVTDHQTQATVLVAMVLRTLARRGAAPTSSSVLVVGADENPVVVALAAAVGIGDVSSWNVTDAQDFPLASVAHRATIVVDLLGLLAPHESGDILAASPPPVVRPDPVASVMALPHLLRALSSHPVTGLDLCADVVRTLTGAPNVTTTSPQLQQLAGLPDPTASPTAIPVATDDDPDTAPAADGRLQTPVSAHQEEMT
ncbi:MAG: hypothetical protein ACXVGB_08465 [Mycobacteriaceae bacterium]